MMADRRNGGGEWDDALAGLNLGARPDIPGHPNGVHPLRIRVGHLRHGGESDDPSREETKFLQLR